MGTQIILPILFILIGVLTRLLPHPANFAPIAAIALFSGVYLPKRYAFLIPLAALLISDLFLGFYGIEMGFVYGGFLISGLIGLWLRDKRNVSNIIKASFFSSVAFYLITNFGVWILPYSWYSKDLSGLMSSYIAALPFFRNSLLGDLFYTATFFGGYELVKIFAKKYSPRKVYKLIF